MERIDAMVFSVQITTLSNEVTMSICSIKLLTLL